MGIEITTMDCHHEKGQTETSSSKGHKKGNSEFQNPPERKEKESRTEERRTILFKLKAKEREVRGGERVHCEEQLGSF